MLQNILFKNHATLHQPLIADGAMGSLLIAKGLGNLQTCLSLLNQTHPHVIQEIHRLYLEAGAQLIQTHSFGANYYQLKRFGEEFSFNTLNKLAVQNARQVVENRNLNALIAGIIGPTGLSGDEIKNEFFETRAKHIFEQASILVAEGVDVVVLETFTQFNELKLTVAAVLKATQNKIPLIISVCPRPDGFLFDDTAPADWVRFIQSSGAEILGINCLDGPLFCEKILKNIKAFHNLPVYLKPNAGLPQLTHQKLVYPITDEEFSRMILPTVQQNLAQIVGGCCGTTPATIKRLAKDLKNARSTHDFNTAG